jgi:hypothetical protein
MTRTIDLDIDIGADAVDYNAIANQESLSGIEPEMRKLEGLVKGIVDELDYFKNGKTDSPALIRVHNLITCAMRMSAGDHNHHLTKFTLRIDRRLHGRFQWSRTRSLHYKSGNGECIARVILRPYYG